MHTPSSTPAGAVPARPAERPHCNLSCQRLHFCLDTFHARLLARWAALFPVLKNNFFT